MIWLLLSYSAYLFNEIIYYSQNSESYQILRILMYILNQVTVKKYNFTTLE